jgi:hypothetical protein
MGDVMIARSLHLARGAALAALLLLGLASTALAQTDALLQKAPEAAEITAIADQNGYVRIIVSFESPISANQIRPDATSIANLKAQVAAGQDGILATHFGSATNPSPGAGFARGLNRFDITPGFAINVTRAELEALAADARVQRINYDRLRRSKLLQSVPLIGMPSAYTLGATGQGWAVAVLDTGVLSNHELLSGKVIAEACFSNSGGGGAGVSPCPAGGATQTGSGSANPTTAQCINSTTNLCVHGTHVAGEAAGLNTSQSAGEPTNGVAKNASVLAIQIFTRFNDIFNCGGPPPCVASYDSDQVSALNYVFSNLTLPGGVKVASVNMSLGGGPNTSGTCDSDIQKTPIDNLRAAGVLTAIAAGNDSSRTQISHPACISSATSVGATTKADTISSFSNMSDVVDLLGPGGTGGANSCNFGANNLDILASVAGTSSATTNLYACFAGTSMATPHVAGAIAAIRAVCPNATADAIESALKSTGTPITDTRSGGMWTKPRIRVDLAVQSLNCQTGPVVTQNPSNLTVTAGQQATFTAMATGTPTPTVIWQVSTNGGGHYDNINWATSTTLSFTTVSSHNGYLFRAVFTNSVGSATTTTATLTVNPGGPVAPAVTQNPSSLTVTAGQQASFTAFANGEPTPTVIWQVSTNGGASFNNIPWATSNTLSFTTISSHNGYLFRAVFTNSAGSATTTTATLTVNPGGPVAPAVTQNPSSLTVTAGQQASFTAYANGEPTPTMIWQVSTDGGASFNNINWATSNTLSFTTVSSHNGYLFRAVFTNSAGSATTTTATLTVNPGGPVAPAVTQNPSNLTVTAGQQASFTAYANGEPTPTMIWQVSTDGGASFNDIPSATSNTYSFTTAAADNGHRFRAVFTNSAGSATTTAAILTVN